MKSKTAGIVATIFFMLSACSNEQSSMKGTENMEAFKTVDDAIAYVESYQGTAENFSLPISESLLDPSGMNMAIIADKILKKGFMPDGFEQKKGYRVFKYKSLE